jgi:hypothetical protein
MRESYLKVFWKVSTSVILIAATSLGSGCAYRLGSPDRSLPGGYHQVFVPIFKNRSPEPGIEVAFTNALIQEFERAKIGRVVDSQQAEVIVEGVIESVTYNKSGTDLSAGPENILPLGTILASQYQILITASITLRRSSDKSVLWAGSFNGERTYTAPQVFTAGINTVNPLYNLSARRQNIERKAFEMMSEAHDRITENF